MVEIYRQVALADFIIINKKDLVIEESLESLKNSVKAINYIADIHCTDYCK